MARIMSTRIARIAFVAGPYVKQGSVVHERYSTVNMVRTIEDVLGLGHLNLNDAYQRPMTAVFDLNQSAWTYNAITPAPIARELSLTHAAESERHPPSTMLNPPLIGRVRRAVSTGQ